MRVHVVSDVHGRSEALARAGEGADALVCLGDLLLFIDYADHSVGIFPELFGAAATTRLVELRTAGRFAEARAFAAELWAGVDGDPRAVITACARRQYAQLFAALPRTAYLTYGNVDLPQLYEQFRRPGVRVLDGEVAEIGGVTFGFVGGGLRSPMRTPYELDESDYDAKLAKLAGVDVLCTHIPPHLPELVYDTVARRFERGSRGLLAAVHRLQPAYLLFGHVHTPLVRERRIGRTRCVNVGHFRATGTPWVLEL